MAAERGSTSPARRAGGTAASSTGDEATRGASLGQRLDQLAARLTGLETRVQNVTATLGKRVDDVAASVT